MPRRPARVSPSRTWIPALALLALAAGCTEPPPGQAAAAPPGETAPPAVPAAAALSGVGDLVTGDYACDEGHWSMSEQRMIYQVRGAFTLHPDGTYRWLDNGGSGTFRYDADTRQVTWLTGPLADKQSRMTTYKRNEKTTQIDIRFTDDVEWSCGHNLS